METWPCGPHLLELEPPDIFHCHVRGPVEEEHAKETMRVYNEEIRAKRGIRIFFISHLEESGDSSFTSAARRYIEKTKVDWKAVIVVGGSPLMQLASTIVALAAAMLSDNPMPTVMVKSMDEARKYIAEARAKEAAKAPSSANASR